MWVSILQNGRKKDSDSSFNQIKQYIKLTDKSSYSTALNKSSALTSSRVEERRDSNKQNQGNGLYRVVNKSKANFSCSNLLAARGNVLGSSSNWSDNGQPAKRIVFKSHEQSFTIVKPRIQQQQFGTMMVNQNPAHEDKKSAYFFRIFGKKNKLRSEMNMNIHNSIYTFKEFLRCCQFAQPKPIDSRIPLQIEGRKTIVFDMDETLIHTNQTMTPNYEIKVPFRSFQNRVGYGYVQVRPHCRQILKRLSQNFDIILFTASTQAYADPIIDHIDPQRVIQARLYRESCSFIKNQVFVKDLRVLGRKLSNVVLVDNAPYSYMMQLENGVPIMPYYRGKDDDELLSLQAYLMRLKDLDDVRSVNKDYFKLHEYMKFDTYDKLISKLYGEWTK